MSDAAATTLRPAEAARRLGISVSTLRRWSDRFAPFLSEQAAGGSGGHRRYGDEDVATLTTLQALLQEGLTYDEAAAAFAAPAAETAGTVEDGTEVEDSTEAEPDAVAGTVLTEEETAALVQLQADLPAAPDVARLVADVLNTLSDSQQIIITGQATGRQLLGVVLQDNFNLKEENVRLRERMLEAERNLFELRRAVDAGRSDERERMRQMESQLFEMQRRLDTMADRRSAPTAVAPPPADAPAVNADGVQGEAPPKRRGFMAWLFGE